MIPKRDCQTADKEKQEKNCEKHLPEDYNLLQNRTNNNTVEVIKK